MNNEMLELQPRTFPRSVQPGIPRLKAPKPGWSTYRFGELLKAVQRPVKLRSDEAYELVTVKRSRGGIEARGKLRGSQISVKSQFRIEEGDFLISKRQIVHGACGVVTAAFHGSVVSNEYSVLLCRPLLDLNFLSYLTHSVYFQQTCFHSSIGVHIEKMIFKLDDWLKWPINIPSSPEQQKIAAFLGTVDAKLAALDAKRTALERFKTGLMQKLLSQHLRFTQDEGQAFPDWQKRRLGDVVKVFSGGTPSASVRAYYGGEIPFIKSGEINSSQTAQFINPHGFKASSAKMVEKGDILYALYGANSGDIAISKIDGAINQAVMCIRTQQVRHYIFQLLAFNRERICAAYLQGGQGNLSAEIVKALTFNLPHLDEQHKIADALSAMDAKIQAVTEQVTKLQTFKKGLLQQMFV